MITVSLSNPLHKALPSSVMKPAIESCRLYTGGDITNKPGARYTCLYPLCTGRFSPRVAFRYFISDSFSVTSLLLTWLFYIAFSLTFTTAELLLLQLRVVWQPRLHSVADTSQYFLTVLLYHLHYNIFSFSGWTSWHKQRKPQAVELKRRIIMYFSLRIIFLFSSLEQEVWS